MGSHSNVEDLAIVWGEALRDRHDPLASEKKMAAILIQRLRAKYLDGRDEWRYIEGDSAADSGIDFGPLGCFTALSDDKDDGQDILEPPGDIDAVSRLCHSILAIETAPGPARAIVLAKQLYPELQWAREQCGVMAEPFGTLKVDTPTKREILVALEAAGIVDSGRSVNRAEVADLIDSLNDSKNMDGREVRRDSDNIKVSLRELRRDGMVLTSGKKAWMRYYLSSLGINIARYISPQENKTLNTL